MSAARMVSYSSPRVVTRSPDSTFQRTTRPDFALWPPAASNNLPERENLRSHGWPSPKGRMPARSRFVVLKRRICFCPAMATTGAHGHGGRAFGPPGGGNFHRQIDGRLGHRDGLGAGGFEQSSCDPFFEHVEL